MWGLSIISNAHFSPDERDFYQWCSPKPPSSGQIGCNFFDVPPTIEELKKKQGKKKATKTEKGESVLTSSAFDGYDIGVGAGCATGGG